MFKKITYQNLQIYYQHNSILGIKEISSAWKVVKIIFTIKPKDAKLVSNYRPITHLPFLSKIFEKILICMFLIHTVKEKKLLHDFNLVSNKSTVFQKKNSALVFSFGIVQGLI